MKGAQRLALEGGPKVRKAAWPMPGRRFGREELRQLKEALEQNTLFYKHGKKTALLCEKMSRLVGAGNVVPCSSGSAAIHGAVKACGVGPADEVITAPITDAGTLLGIVYEGAIPVFADVNTDSFNMTPASVEARITPRTRAVIVVHLMGNPADVEGIVAVCRGKGIKVIEDCAQAWGAKMNGRPLGTFGDCGCFSLNDFKHISCGEGGLIVTDDGDLAWRAALSIDKCYDRVRNTRGMEFCAPNYRITELQSAVAIAQLGRLKGLVTKRNALGARLGKGLRKAPGIIPCKVLPGAWPSWWFYMFRIDTGVLGVDADTFIKAVAAEGVPLERYCEPVHYSYKYLVNQSAFNHSKWPFSSAKAVPPYGRGYCPSAEMAYETGVRFKLNHWLGAREIDDTVKAVSKVAACFKSRKSG
ncbi:MAG: DegT/DnrJ/EryC1/StrS family aminotransferase [Lentisphaerae bacterium]|nr:DegT/DnrJ/EryC1/StrS family aminotransferase [Lentisphaerota bacterium]